MSVDPTRKPTQPYRAARDQWWGSDMVAASHEEALYGYGELVLFTMLWRPADHAAGLVGRCTECAPGATESRYQQAFQQPIKRECIGCYGTTFEGGIRAQIVRPALFADRAEETTDEARGTVEIDTVSFETTADFVLHKGDYAVRFDGVRYQVEEKRAGHVRPGFSDPGARGDGFVGGCTAHREEETTVAYRIPVLGGSTLAERLTHPDQMLVYGLSAGDQIPPGGYLTPAGA